jgi:hypothetical protein
VVDSSVPIDAIRFAGVGTAASEGAITGASWGMFRQLE